VLTCEAWLYTAKRPRPCLDVRRVVALQAAHERGRQAAGQVGVLRVRARAKLAPVTMHVKAGRGPCGGSNYACITLACS